MGQSFFIWKNKDCRAMGVKLSGPVAIVRPEERVEHVQIPGRSGDLTELEGAEVYNSYIQTATILVHGGYRVREIYNWLKGAGYVTFSGEPDRRQKARVIGAITLNKHSYNLDWWTGEVQFYCQPLKEKLQEETVTVTSSGTSVRNAGDVTAKPMIRMTASSTSAIINAGENALVFTGITSGHVYLIDSETCEVSDITTPSTPVNCTSKTYGSFPELKTGANSITGSGWSQLVFFKRERFL